MTTKRNKDELAATDEAASELEHMSNADLYRLEQFARLRTLGFAWLDWQDVLQESIDRVLSGSRRWPRSVSFISFMCGVIRSVTNEFWKARGSHGEVTAADLPHRDNGESLFESVADYAPGPEREAIAKDILRGIQALFENDKACLGVLHGLSKGMTPAEIQKAEKLTARSYASAQKRIRRSIARALQEGMI